MNPDEMRNFLARKIVAQRADMDEARRYMHGEQAMQWIDPDVAKYLKGRIKPLPVNICRVSIEALAQRLRVTGFRSSPGEVVDRQLARIWQRNNMDEQSQLAQAECLVLGRSYFMAWADSQGRARITAETAMQLAVHRDELTMEIDGVLKRWLDPDGYAMSLLITPDLIRTYRSRQSAAQDPLYGEPPLIDNEAVILNEQVNPLGRVPVVALVNRPELDNLDGSSDLTDLLPIVDGIGKLGSDMMVASEYGASPRRWAVGVSPDQMTQEQSDSLNEKVKRNWEMSHAAKIIISGSSDTRFGQFDAVELTNFTNAIEMLMSQAATVASLPPYFVSTTVASPTSADAIRASESRLSAKAYQRHAWWSGAFEELMRLAVLIETGVDDPNLDDLETLWANPEPATIAQTADAQAKLIGAGILDRRASLESLGVSPLEIDRILTATNIEQEIA